jgi:hypothetical protein
MLTQEHKDHGMQVCKDLLDCPTTPTAHCPDKDAVIAAVRKRLASATADFYEGSMMLLFIAGKYA